MIRNFLVYILVGVALPVIADAQSQPSPELLDSRGLWAFHARKSFGAGSLAGSAVFAATMQALDSPSGWKADTGGYARRFASTFGTVGVRNAAALAFESALTEDRRYQRSRKSGFAGRTGHIITAEFVAKTSHGSRFAYSRVGSALVAGYVSTLWYPSTLSTTENSPRTATPNTASLGLEQAGIIMVFDLLSNAGAEVGPGIRKKLESWQTHRRAKRSVRHGL